MRKAVGGRVKGARVLDPSARWGARGKPAYACWSTFGGAPYTQDPAELRVSTSPSSGRRPTTVSATAPARGWPRGRSAPRPLARCTHLATVSTPSPSCASSTSGTLRWCPPTRPRPTRRSRRPSARRAAGVLPVALGGDHSITHPAVRGLRGTVRARRAAPRRPRRYRPAGLWRRPLPRHVDARAARRRRRATRPLRADRAARLLAGGGGVRLAARAGHHHPPRPRGARDRTAREVARRRCGGRDRAGVADRRCRRPRPRVRPRDGDAGARRDDLRGAARCSSCAS